MKLNCWRTVEEIMETASAVISMDVRNEVRRMIEMEFIEVADRTLQNDIIDLLGVNFDKDSFYDNKYEGKNTMYCRRSHVYINSSTKQVCIL